MKPVLHRVIVKPDPVEEKTASGIVLAKNIRTEQKASVIGTVVSVGATAFISFGTTAEEMGIIPGAKVHYARYSGAEVADKELLILNDEDILCIINEKTS